jgi:hypothetical protein
MKNRGYKKEIISGYHNKAEMRKHLNIYGEFSIVDFGEFLMPFTHTLKT